MITNSRMLRMHWMMHKTNHSSIEGSRQHSLMQDRNRVHPLFKIKFTRLQLKHQAEKCLKSIKGLALLLQLEARDSINMEKTIIKITLRREARQDSMQINLLIRKAKLNRIHNRILNHT